MLQAHVAMVKRLVNYIEVLVPNHCSMLFIMLLSDVFCQPQHKKYEFCDNLSNYMSEFYIFAVKNKLTMRKIPNLIKLICAYFIAAFLLPIALICKLFRK